MPSAAPLRRVLCLALGLAASPASAPAAEPPTSAPRFTVRHERVAGLLAFTPDGRTLVGRGGHGRVTLTDAANGEPRGAFEPKGYAWALAVSGDGVRLALGTNRGVVEVWDLATLRPLRELPVWEWNVNAVAFSPDGRRLAAGYRTGAVDVWDAGPGEAP